jgi:hypothetical protein
VAPDLLQFGDAVDGVNCQGEAIDLVVHRQPIGVLMLPFSL